MNTIIDQNARPGAAGLCGGGPGLRPDSIGPKPDPTAYRRRRQHARGRHDAKPMIRS